MQLGVNIDHVATLRNARGENEPSVIQAAKICIESGANGITVHLREDRRHIKDDDVYALKNELKCRLNLEMAATEEIQKIALKLLPESCCIVPERRLEVTTEGGLNVLSQTKGITDFVRPLIDAGINVSLFIDADENQVKAAAETGAQFIELHTGKYAREFGKDGEITEFEKLKKTCNLAQELGLKVNAGHGLNYNNVSRMHEINGLFELNIGHSIISKSIFIGLDNAVREMLRLVNKN